MSRRPPSPVPTIPREVFARFPSSVTSGYVSDRTGLNRAEVQIAMGKLGATYSGGRWRTRAAPITYEMRGL